MARRFRLTRQSDLTIAETSTVETLAGVAAAMAALYLGRAIAIPIAIAILISFSMGPLVTWLRRRKIGRVPSVGLVVFPALFLIGAFAYIVTAELGRLAENIPAYETNIEQKFARIQSSLPAKDLIDQGTDFIRRLGLKQDLPPVRPVPRGTSRATNGPLSDPLSGPAPIPVEIEQPNPSALDILKSVVGPLVEPAADAGLVLLFVGFFLLQREHLRDRFIRLVGSRDINRTTMAMDEAGYRVSRYLLLQLLVNVLLGIAVGSGLFLIGVPNAALWGGMATVLRFIPYLGITIAAFLPLSLVFAVDPGWTMLFWTAGLFVGLELLVGNIIEPWLYGASTGLSAVAVVISAIFWTWLWGGIGLLLATPLTVCVAVLGRYVPQLGFLEVLLGNAAPLKPEESFYQRLLAGDPDEATQQAEEYLKSAELVDFCDQVALPALALAERDHERDVLDDEHQRRVIDGIELVFENLDDGFKATIDGVDAAPAGAVLCVAGRGDLDEAAAAVLSRLLVDHGYDARTMSLASALRPAAERGEPPNAIAVCLSYMNADSAPHARYLGRRFRRWIGPKAKIVAGFWAADGQALTNTDLHTETGADVVVTSFRMALAAFDNTLAAVGPTRDSATEPALAALAERAASAVSATP